MLGLITNDSSMFFLKVLLSDSVEVLFELPLVVVPAGATVPSGFTKTITFNNESYTFTFPNKDVAGKDWNYFRIN